MVDPRFEPLLRAVLTGGIERDAPEVRETSERDPRFARELAAHLSLVDALEREGVLARAKGLAPLPAEEGVARFVREQARRRSWGWAAVVACAAALLLFLAFWALGKPDGASTPEDFPLGTDKVVCKQPVGEVEGFELFRWESSASGGLYEVWVFDQHGNELEHVPGQGELEWRPSPSEHTAWPQEIEWRVDWFDDADELLDSDTAQAQRRP